MMNSWFKPSMQQHWWITKAVKAAFSPLTNYLESVKDTLTVWNSAYKPERKDIDKK